MFYERLYVSIRNFHDVEVGVTQFKRKQDKNIICMSFFEEVVNVVKFLETIMEV